MTIATETEPKIVAGLIKTVSEKPIMKSSFSLVAGTYTTLSSYVKPVCPATITTKWEAAEKYIVDNQDEIVAKTDEYVNVATKFAVDVNDARKNQKATEFLLSTVEDLVKEDDGFETADEETTEEETESESQTTTSRVYGIGNTVSKTVYRKATAGLQNLQERTTKVVHIDLMSYANDFVDTSVKPKYDYVAGLPSTVADKFNTYAEPVKTAVTENLVAPATKLYEMKTVDNKTYAEVATVAKNNALVAWNDKVVVPLSNRLDVPDLNYSTLKPKAAEYGNEKYAALSEYVLSALNQLTTTPITELKYSEIPASVYAKVAAEVAERYLEFTGKEFDIKTAPKIVLELSSTKAQVYALYIVDAATPYIPKTIYAKLAGLEGEEKVKAE